MTAITSRLPFGLSTVIEPNMLGYLLINLCTFFIDLTLFAVFHGRLRWPIPVAVTCSYGTASVISYILNRVLNFRSHADVGRQFPVYVAVSASNYLIFVLGLTYLLSSVGVYYLLSRVFAACCEGVYLYCMMRWIVFRDVTGGDGSGDSADGDSADGDSADRDSADRDSADRDSADGDLSPGPATGSAAPAPLPAASASASAQESVVPETPPR
jgi:putative flippase GtrA